MSVLAQDADTLLLGARTAAAAAASAALVLAAAAWPWRARRPARAWGPPLAIAAAFAAAFALSRGLPALSPEQALQWLFHATLAGGVVGALEAARGRGAPLARAALAALLPFALLEFQRERHWGRAEGATWTIALAALAFASWSALARAAARAGSGAPLALGLSLACALAAGAFRWAGGSLLTLLPLALALALGACALLALAGRGPALGAGGSAPFVLAWLGLAWAARWLYELSAPGLVLLSLVPLAGGAAALVPASRARARTVLELAGPALLAGAALLVEWRAAPAAYEY